jgi:hypothetical protein
VYASSGLKRELIRGYFDPDGHELGFALPLLPGFRAIAARSGLPFQEAAVINDASHVKHFTFFHYRLSVEQNSFATAD